MSEHEGGIGGIGLPDVAEKPERLVPRLVDGEADLIAAATAAMNDNSRTLTALTTMIEAQAAEVAQLRGQVARFEAILPQYNAAFRDMDARMNALAQQVMRNTRFAALDLATKSRQPGEKADSVVVNAGRYLQFIAPPEPEAAPAPAGTVTH